MPDHRTPGGGPPAEAREAADVPLTVWPCGQTTAPRQRTGRYVPASKWHPAKMLPELARRIIIGFSQPGGLVVDPMCGSGTTLVEAAALRRRCVGVEIEPRWAELAAANLDQALTVDQRRRVDLRRGDARQLVSILDDHVGAVDLVATSPPYASAAQTIDKPAWDAGGSLGDRTTRDYSRDPSNLGHARGQSYTAAMTEVYTGCRALLRPGGLLVVVTRSSREGGRLLDLAGLTVRLATGAGLHYLQHIVALHAAIRDGQLTAHPSFWQLLNVRRARARGEPAHLPVHEDVLVFTKPRNRPGEHDGPVEGVRP